MSRHLRKTPWPESAVARLIEMWTAGYAVRDIAADPEVNRHRDEVSAKAREIGLPKRERIRRGPRISEFIDRMPRQIEKWPKDMGTFDDHPRAV